MPDESMGFEQQPSPLITDVSGVVLAGGKSSRYGKNKAFVEVAGIPLIERTLQVMQSIFKQVVLITNTPEEYGYLGLSMYRDLIKDLGPLGGIYTALNVIPTETGFFVASDMPSLNPALIRHMVALKDNVDVVVPRIGWKLEALHSIYSKRCIPEIEKLIHAGVYQVFRFFTNVRVRYVDRDEILKFDPRLMSFYNINRPEELQHWLGEG
jgi:molybdopterin-guanine dinucleotide biosynthesis protein A